MTRSPSRVLVVLLTCLLAVACSSTPVPAVPDAGEPDAGQPEQDAGPGAPQAALASTPLDFGRSDCAGAAAATQTLTLSNQGAGPLTWSATVTGEAFQLSETSGTVAAGQQASLTVTPPALSSAVAAGSEHTGTLTVTTNDPAHASTAVPLKVTAAGATLTLSPATVSFGLVPVGSAAPTADLALTNTGTQAVTVAFAAPSDAQFGISWTGSPATVSLAPGASLPALRASFAPTGIAPGDTTAALQVTGAVCGAGASGLAVRLTGRGTSGAVSLPTDIAFGTHGLVPCGTQANALTFPLTNTGNAPFSWTGSLARGLGSPFTISPTSGTVPANGGTAMLVVTTTAIPAHASTAQDEFGDVFTLSTDVPGDSPHPITIHQTAQGAVLAFAPGTLDFGGVPVNTTASAPFSLVNNGNADANVSFTLGNAKFSLAAAGPTPAVAASSLAQTVTFAPGSSVAQQNDTVAVSVAAQDVLCAPLPAPLTLAGQGTNGSVSYSPVALDFGRVNCGATAAPKNIVFTNSGNQDYSVSAALGRGASSPFAVTLSPASGLVAAQGGTLTVTVTPRAIPQTAAVTDDLFGDTLTVTTSAAGDKPHAIALRQTAQGAIFSVSTSSVAFGSVVVGQTGGYQYSVTNSGNAAGTLKFQPTNAVFAMPSALVVAGGASASPTAQFTPTAPQPASDTATVSAPNTVLCQPLPLTTMSLSGSGTTAALVALSTNTLSFGNAGLVDCGTQAAAKTVMVTSSASGALSMTYALAGGSSSPYTVSGPASLAAGGSGTITLTPKAIPATSSTAADAFADTLTITASNATVTESHPVALHETAQGVILTLNPTNLAFSAAYPSSQSKGFTVGNQGNVAAAYTLSLSGANAGDFTVSPTSGSAAAGGNGTETATFTPPFVLGPTSRVASLAVTTSAVRCAPLPAALSLAGTAN